MRLATLNIGGPSVSRAERLIEYLPDLRSDVLVLTETRPNDGTRVLLNTLERSGWCVTATPIEDRGERGVALVQRNPRIATDELVTHMGLAHRLAVTTVAAAVPIAVLGAYVPSRDASQAKIARKRSFLEQMVRTLRSCVERPLVLLGDFNIVSRQHLPQYSAFRSWEYAVFDDLERMGLVDAYRWLHPREQVHSWIGRRGAGYRYDYAFVSQPLAGAVATCEYVHEARLMGLTDHAAVVLTMDDAAVGRVPHVGAPRMALA
jgi:exodeoxyribonuclease III